MSSRTVLMLAFALLVTPGLAAAKSLGPGVKGAGGACPPAVTRATQKAHPSSKITACKQENEKGKVQYEVKLETKEAKKLELDVSPEGSILLTEEAVAVDSVPRAVMTAFTAKYPQMKAASADKQTKSDGSVSYEIAWKDAKGKRHEATFSEKGPFLEEE
jgi:hypothetical protein